MQYRLGKLPARKGAVKLEFENYSLLPAPPNSVNHSGLVKYWGMLGNDQYGDCVWAGAAHETMLWNREAGKNVIFITPSVLSDYSTVTGFNPDVPSTDNGTDMQAAASFRLKTGVTDGKKRHKIGAYVALKPGNIQQIKQAIWLFGAVGIGIQFPDSAMEQFNANKPWTVVDGAAIDGGHYVPAVGYDPHYLYVVSWGRVLRASWAFVERYMDEGIAYLSTEFMKDGKSLDGFDLTTLQADFKQLTGGQKGIVTMLNSNTTLGKTLKVALWVGISAAVSVVLTILPGLDLKDLAWLTPAINTILVFLKNLADKNVANY